VDIGVHRAAGGASLMRAKIVDQLECECGGLLCPEDDSDHLVCWAHGCKHYGKKLHPRDKRVELFEVRDDEDHREA